MLCTTRDNYLSAQEINRLVNHVVCYFGLSHVVLHDCDPRLTSHFSNILRILMEHVLPRPPPTAPNPIAKPNVNISPLKIFFAFL